MKQIITVTLNPALDLTGNLSELVLGQVNGVTHASLRAAGKGINVASVLAQFGHQVTVTGFLGRDNDRDFCQLFSSLGMIDAFIRVDGKTRTNIKLAERSGRVSDINFPSFNVSGAEQQRLLNKLTTLADGNCLVVIAGSLPDGVEPNYMVELISCAKAVGAQVYVDTSGAALKAALTSEADLFKPNLDELAQVLGVTAETERVVLAAKNILASNQQSLVLSAGADVLYSWGELGQFHCQPPEVRVESTVGAGDTLVAGLCLGWLYDDMPQGCLTRACALAAWAVTQHGVDIPNDYKLAELMAKVVIKPH
ncbi:1-phosphofructokinase [Neiella sp. HB171785]|uniref:Phosphofructokinase n=1 Tax=Neiella litorisoli TaxID=2771431 RepID=A0A8J6QIK5_9GAMM|nr:1-phosphofructokinase [Neiella litorisoli]MBD1390740.1 1-phosphofructokinase [Neiella litorisoli]